MYFYIEETQRESKQNVFDLVNFFNKFRVISGLDMPDHCGDVVDDSGAVTSQLGQVVDRHERKMLSLNVWMFVKQTEKLKL